MDLFLYIWWEVVQIVRVMWLELVDYANSVIVGSNTSWIHFLFSQINLMNRQKHRRVNNTIYNTLILFIRNCLKETVGPDFQNLRNVGRRFCMNQRCLENFYVLFTKKKTFKDAQCPSLTQNRNVSQLIWYFARIVGMEWDFISLKLKLFISTRNQGKYIVWLGHLRRNFSYHNCCES